MTTGPNLCICSAYESNSDFKEVILTEKDTKRLTVSKTLVACTTDGKSGACNAYFSWQILWESIENQHYEVDTDDFLTASLKDLKKK